MIKIHQLTARQVATLARPGLHADGQRLFLQVTKTNARSWILRYDYRGRTYSMGLGSAYAVPLHEARKRAQAASMLLTEGVNPLEQKRAQRATQQVAQKTQPFAWCAREYGIVQQSSWTMRETKRFNQLLVDFANPHIGKISVRDITADHIRQALEPVWHRAATAKRLRRYIEHILGWADAKKLRSGDNPATRDALRHLLPKVKQKTVHHPSLPWKEVGAFVRDLRADSSIQCRALELLILSALRTNEVLGARWDEFDFAAKIWVIPVERMKMGKEHDVPLTSAMLRLLDAMPRVAGNPYLFPGKGSGGKLNLVSMQQWIRRSLGNSTVTVHGFRTTFRTWAAECTDYPREWAEKALAHTVGNEVEEAYQRSTLLERRRPLMEAWGEFVTKPPAKVISLARLR